MANIALSGETVADRLKPKGLALLGPYVGSVNKNQPIECLVCGNRWEPRLANIFSGTGCPKCSTNRMKANKSTPLEKIESVFKERRMFLDEPYRGNAREVHMIGCLSCGHKWKSNIQQILGGAGCRKCAGLLTPTEEEAKQTLKRRGISIVPPYVNSTQKRQTFSCNTCGCAWATSYNHIVNRNSGCPACAGQLPLNLEKVDEILSERGLQRNGDYIGSTHKRTPLRCNACRHEWYAKITNIRSRSGCPSCARDPWFKQGIYHLHHPHFEYQYVGISWNPEVRLTEHQQDDGRRGELARALDTPYEFTFQEVFDVMDVAWEEDRLPEYVRNWFEQNPHGKLPNGRLWFVDWDNLTPLEQEEPARVPRFVADWIETEMIRLISLNFAADNPYLAAGKFGLANIAKNAITA